MPNTPIKPIDYEAMTLKEAVVALFDILDETEETENGISFNPTKVSTCRAMHIEPVSKLLLRMKVLCGQ